MDLSNKKELNQLDILQDQVISYPSEGSVANQNKKIENLRKTKKIHMTLMPGMRAHIKIETIAMGIRGVEESKQDWSVDKGQLTIFSPFAGWLKCHKTKKGLRCKRSVDIFVFRKINKKAKLELLDDD